MYMSLDGKVTEEKKDNIFKRVWNKTQAGVKTVADFVEEHPRATVIALVTGVATAGAVSAKRKAAVKAAELANQHIKVNFNNGESANLYTPEEGDVHEVYVHEEYRDTDGRIKFAWSKTDTDMV